MKRIIAILLSICCLVAIVGCFEEAAVKYDLPLMLMLDDVLYINTGDESDRLKTDIMKFDGEIISAVSGTEIPTENGQSNFGSGYLYVYGNENTVEVLINDAFWIFEADEKEEKSKPVRDNSKLLESPPKLSVFTQSHLADEECRATLLSYTWTHEQENGENVTLCADALHPLQARELVKMFYIYPSPVSSIHPLAATLMFEVEPDRVSIRAWHDSEWGNVDAESIAVENDGMNFMFLDYTEPYIYEVTAHWETTEKYSGSASYVFCCGRANIEWGPENENIPIIE